MLRSILFFNIDYSVLFKFPLRVMASFLPEIVLPYFGCKNSGLAIVYLPNLHSILQTVMESVKKTSRHNNCSIKRGGQTDSVVKELANINLY